MQYLLVCLPACILAPADSLNSYIQAFLVVADDVFCLCGDVIPVNGYVSDLNPFYYCGYECTHSPGRWCIGRRLTPINDRMRVYPLIYPTTTSGMFINIYCIYIYIYAIYIC